MRAATFLGLLLVIAPTAHAQSVAVEVSEVTDNRFTGSMMTGSLEVHVKLNGAAVEKATAARVVVKEARDDRGNVLPDESMSHDFTARNVNDGTLQFTLKQPPRDASTVRVKGTAELYVPSRDPNATVKVEKAFSHLDAPIASKLLKAAKVDLTLLSPAGYTKQRNANRIDDKKIEEARARAKKEGMSDKEFEMTVGLAKALEAIDQDAPEGSVILSGKRAAFDRILSVDVLGGDGKPIDMTARTLTTHGDDSVMMMQPSHPPPANASLQFQLITEKVRVSSPFELTVRLP